MILSALGNAFAKLHRRWNWFKYRRQIKRSTRSVELAIADGDVQGLATELCHQVNVYLWPFQLDQLLFSRKSRPHDPAQSLTIFKTLWTSSQLPDYQRFYSGIAMLYTVLLSDLTDNMEDALKWLEYEACLEGGRPNDLYSNIRNRENPYKRLISARACLLQWALSRGEAGCQLVNAIGRSNCNLISSLDFQRIGADALFRSISNLLRGLLALSFSSVGIKLLLPELLRLAEELNCERYQRVRRIAQEDHWLRLQEVINLLQQARILDDDSLRERRLMLMLNSSSAKLKRGALLWLHAQPVDC